MPVVQGRFQVQDKLQIYLFLRSLQLDLNIFPFFLNRLLHVLKMFLRINLTDCFFVDNLVLYCKRVLAPGLEQA